MLLLGFVSLKIADKGLPGYMVPRTLGGANQALQMRMGLGKNDDADWVPWWRGPPRGMRIRTRGARSLSPSIIS